MTWPAVYLPEARDDIDEAYSYYESPSAGLGSRFIAALQDQIARIQGNPSSYAVVHHDVRASSVRRFPYVVYYRVEPSRVAIIAVQHGRRDWSHWQRRT
jgi:plasmid stabilization system protein ParE